MSLDELDVFVRKIENLRHSNNYELDSMQNNMERSKLASKMADAIIDVETQILSPRGSVISSPMTSPVSSSPGGSPSRKGYIKSLSDSIIQTKDQISKLKQQKKICRNKVKDWRTAFIEKEGHEPTGDDRKIVANLFVDAKDASSKLKMAEAELKMLERTYATNKDSSKQRQLRQKYVGNSKRLIDMFVAIERSPLNRIFIGAEEAILDFLVDCMVGEDYTIPCMIDIVARVATYGRPFGKDDLDMVEGNVRDLYTTKLPKRDGAGTLLHEAAKFGKLYK